MHVRPARRQFQVMAAVVAVVGLAACGSSAKSGSSTSGSTGAGQAGSPTTSAATSSSNPGSSNPGSSDPAASNPSAVAAAATTKKYTASPTAFPVSVPLPHPFPAGKTFGYLQCGAPVCAQQAVLIGQAMKVVHGRLIVAKGGASTQQLQSAMSSLLAQKPDGLVIPSVSPDSIAPQLAQARAAGIPITAGFQDIAKYHVPATAFGRSHDLLVGRLLADWVGANKGPKANIVFYTTPELDISAPEEEAFRAEISKVCSACSVRAVKVPIATYGSSAPSLVVSDLQAHPKTTIAVFAANDAATGLAAAMKSAGLTTPYIGNAPTASNLQDIRSGRQAAGLGVDFHVGAWEFVDELLRLIEKAPLSAAETQGLVPVRWVTASNLTGDVSQGFYAYPDYVSRFTKLWTGQ